MDGTCLTMDSVARKEFFGGGIGTMTMLRTWWKLSGECGQKLNVNRVRTQVDYVSDSDAKHRTIDSLWVKV